MRRSYTSAATCCRATLQADIHQAAPTGHLGKLQSCLQGHAWSAVAKSHLAQQAEGSTHV